VPDVTSGGIPNNQPADLLDRAIATMREPVAIGPDFDVSLRNRLMADPAPKHVDAAALGVQARRTLGRRSLWGWMIQPRTMRVRPLTLGAGVGAAMAVAAGLVAVLPRISSGPGPASTVGVSPSSPAALRQTVEVRFVLVAPGAHRVSVLGDFNHWSAAATPLVLTPGASSTWVTSVRLEPGRHVYAFMVDGTRWAVDPTAPRSLDDDFGHPSTVLTVAAGTT
jgi:Glycogen recognition site of AMP-activated protein kinase